MNAAGAPACLACTDRCATPAHRSPIRTMLCTALPTCRPAGGMPPHSLVMDRCIVVTPTMWSCAPQRPAALSAQHRYHSRSAGFPSAGRHSRHCLQVLTVAASAQAERLPHGLARHSPLPHITRLSALHRRRQALPGLSTSTPDTCSSRQASPFGASRK